MKLLLVFNYGIVSAVSLYFSYLSLFKGNRTRSKILFTFFLFFSIAEFLLIISINTLHSAGADPVVYSAVIFIPLIIFVTLAAVTRLIPAEKISGAKLFFTLTALFTLIDAVAVYFAWKNGMILPDAEGGLERNNASMLQSAIITASMIAVSLPLLIKMRNLLFSRIRAAINLYLYGLIISYVLFIALYFAGNYFFNLSLLQNPALPAPFFLIIIMTNHLVYDINRADFAKFYKILLMNIGSLIVFFTPVYFFLKYYSAVIHTDTGDVYIKSILIFIYLTLAYRIISPFIRKFRLKKEKELQLAINKTLSPPDGSSEDNSTDNLWGFVTNNSFLNLKENIKIKSAYFMLLNIKENSFQYTFGYGPELKPMNIDSDSRLAQYITSQPGVFEKTSLITETPLKEVDSEVLDFFNQNGIEISITFKNMSNSIIGFLLLGGLEGNRPYTVDHLAAFEIFRIKLENLLITDLILDEVTAEQVAEHDRTVVTTVKKRIIPDELASIPGIRMSSFHMDNSRYGGDFFDSVKISADKSIIFIADTSYSGIDSALAGMELYSILHTRTLIFNSPEKVLNTMNQVIKTSRLTRSYIRCSCVIVSSDGNYAFSNASHNRMLLFDPLNGDFTDIENENIPLGIEIDHRYSVSSGRLRDGEIALLYSDGLFSSCNEDGESFPVDRLKNVIRKTAKESPSVIAREIYEEYKLFTGAKEQLSDVTVILFKKMKRENEQH